MHFSRSTLLTLAVVALMGRNADAAKVPKGDRAELGAVIYKYNMGETVTVATQANQHVICDTCPKTQLLAPYRDPIVAKLKLNPIEPGAPEKVSDPSDVAVAKPMVPATTEVATDKSLAVIGFRLDSYRLDKKATATIAKIAKGLKEQNSGEVLVRVDGYTCKLGSKKHNDKLAVKRAKAVADALKRQGIAVAKVSGEGVCCYVDEKHLEPNRRVEIFEERSAGKDTQGGKVIPGAGEKTDVRGDK